MLIYNHKKEFLGIDESDLRALGLSNMKELENEAADIADLFVKSPGYIHNFKHVHWIDYITCNENAVESKVIISLQGRTYQASLDINTLYLLSDPAQKGFVVTLLNIKTLSGAQADKIRTETAKTTAAVSSPPPKEQEFVYRATYDPYEVEEEPEEPIKGAELSFEDVSPKYTNDEPKSPPAYIEEEPPKSLAIQQETQEQDHFAGYIYNPRTASEDLGLPMDLVEEFVQDFIAQADSFKADLYNSVANEDIDDLKIQSHKLKGVSANLRIEDALDILTKINTLQDPALIKLNLDKFYKIIDRLKNKKTMPENVKEDIHKEDEGGDMLILSFKEEKLQTTPATDDGFFDSDLNTQNDDSTISKPSSDYDKKRIAREMGIGEEHFEELLQDYVNDTHDLALMILSDIENGELHASKENAIKIKGMSENMRIRDLDEDIRSIIDSSDAQEIRTHTQNIIAKTNRILENAEGI